MDLTTKTNTVMAFQSEEEYGFVEEDLRNKNIVVVVNAAHSCPTNK